MKKIRYIILTIILLLPVSYKALEIEGLYSPHVIIYNKDEGKVIYEKDAEAQTSIASLTKIMTTLVAIENIEDLNKTVTITYDMLSEVPYDASVAGLSEGDTVTYEDLLYAVMLPSGADAADSLAVSLFGSVSAFVDKMNEKKDELKLEHTHFANTTGYDAASHYSSAKDLLTLLNYALDNEEFKKIYETKSYTTTNGLRLESTLSGINRRYYNYDLSYVLGSKTGSTDIAGLCLSTLSQISGVNIITITLNVPYELEGYKNVEDLDKIHSALLDQYDLITFVNEGDSLVTLETKYAKEKELEITSPKTISRYINLPYDKKDLKIKYDGEEVIKNTTKKGTKVGTIKVYYKDELIDSFDAITNKNLSFSVWEYLKTNIVYYIILIVFIVLSLSIIKKPKKRKLFKH